MVWTYEESYPGYPYLIDWSSKESTCCIKLSETVIDRTIEKAKLDQHKIEVIETKTDGILKPSFYFAGNKTDRPYQISLSLVGGLARRVYSTIDEGQINNYQAIKLHTRRLGLGGFEDFKALGSCAVERFPKIAEEIVLPPTDFPNDIPVDRLDFILRYRNQCLEVLNWETTQQEIFRRFCSLFETFILAARGEPGVGLILRNGDDKFTPEQMRELSDLINPLR